MPHPLFQLNAVAIDSLEYRIEFPGNNGLVLTFSSNGGKIRRHAEAQLNRRSTALVEFLHQAGKCFLWLADIRACQGRAIRPLGILAQSIPLSTDVAREAVGILGCGREHSISLRQPESRDLRTVQALPEEFRRSFISRYAPLEPIGLVPCQLQELWHLRMVAKGVERPTH